MTNAKRTPWEPAENLALARLYFTMLHAAAHGHPYNKAAMIRDVSQYRQNEQYYGIRKPLADRSRGSIEAKLMNASAAHRDLMREGLIRDGLTMDGFGYRALPNYQRSLKDAVLAEHHRLEQMRKEEGVA